MPANIIETINLTKQYRNGVLALDNLNLKIPKGEVVGYVGSNGAGKTTTMKIITNLIRPTSGESYIDGFNTISEPKKALRNVGALIEIPGIYEYLTPKEMLTYYGKVYGMTTNDVMHRIGEVLHLLRLSEWENTKIGSFSTGMVRRLNIAKAMIHNPKILLLDEPVLGLDPQGIMDIRELIKHLQRTGVTIFLSSHLLQEISETCNRIIFLERGRVVRTDTVSEIKKRTELKKIHVVFLTSPGRAEIDKITKVPHVTNLEGRDGMFHIGYDGKPETSSAILEGLLASGFKVISFTPERASLEDYYVSVIQGGRRMN